MAVKTVSRGVRLPSDIVQRIEDFAKQSGGTFNDAIRDAADLLLSPDNSMAAMTQRLQVLEQNVMSLVSVLEPYLPLLIEAEDKTFRAWSVGRLVLGWADLVVESGGMPSKEQWQSYKADQIKKYDELRAEIKSKRSGIEGDDETK